MKNAILFFLFFISTCLTVFSQDSESGKIIFYRDNDYFSSIVSYNVIINGNIFARLDNTSYLEYDCLPGEYSIVINNFENTRSNLTVEAGKTYYFWFRMNKDSWENIPELIQMDEDKARQAILEEELRKEDHLTKSSNLRKHRFGINIGGGIGFENHDIFETSEGKDYKFSFGGGVSFALEYGYEFHRNFDLSSELAYRANHLRPYPDNAKFNFTRGAFSITPAFVVPIGSFMKLRLGAGPDCYFNNSLLIEGTHMGGFDDTWRYSTAVGFHVSARLAIYTSDNFSLIAGVKYLNVSYNYMESERRNFPDKGSEFDKANGSGIDFSIGLNFHL